MRWVSDPATLAWLATSPALEWDEHNMAKLTKHRVTMVEIEELFAGDFVFSGRIVEPPHVEPRWVALGTTAGGRRLTLILTRRGDRLRPISCRAMARAERRFYAKRIDEEEVAGQGAAAAPAAPQQGSRRSAPRVRDA